MAEQDGRQQPVEPERPDPLREAARERLQQEHAGTPTDAGRTSGGGSLGHKQPPDVASESPIRNQPPDARPER